MSKLMRSITNFCILVAILLVVLFVVIPLLVTFIPILLTLAVVVVCLALALLLVCWIGNKYGWATYKYERGSLKVSIPKDDNA